MPVDGLAGFTVYGHMHIIRADRMFEQITLHAYTVLPACLPACLYVYMYARLYVCMYVCMYVGHVCIFSSASAETEARQCSKSRATQANDNRRQSAVKKWRHHRHQHLISPHYFCHHLHCGRAATVTNSEQYNQKHNPVQKSVRCAHPVSWSAGAPQHTSSTCCSRGAIQELGWIAMKKSSDPVMTRTGWCLLDYQGGNQARPGWTWCRRRLTWEQSHQNLMRSAAALQDELPALSGRAYQ